MCMTICYFNTLHKIVTITPNFSKMSMRKQLLITASSILITTALVGNAYYQKKQFYPTIVHLTRSTPVVAVLYLQIFILMVMVGRMFKKLFFGELRPIELEHVTERLWYSVTETCLAFTVFRDDFTAKFIALFILLFFIKSFHWLAEERVDFIERSPVITLVFHVRIICLLLVLSSLNVNFILFAYNSTILKGASVQLVFGFEYAVLLIALINIVIKYILHFVDLRRQTPWEHKAVFLLYTELIIGFLKVTLYALFGLIMFRMYTLPVFVLRSMYYSVREFRKAFSDVIKSRRAIRNMLLYPDATPEELLADDNLCIICREEMVFGVASKKLPCNHIFHTTCLRSWFQRQQTCPTCRLNILSAPTIDHNQPRQGNGPRQSQPNTSSTNATSRQNLGGSMAGSSATIPPSYSFPEGNMPFHPSLPPMIFNLAPPLPSFESLSDDELRALESQMRVGLEARIRYLQSAQTLLDTSVVMMQQYCSIITTLEQRTTHTIPADVTPPAAAEVPSTSVNRGLPAGPSTSTHSPSQKKEQTFLEESLNSGNSASSSEEQNSSPEQKVVRQRRLDMFDKI